VGAELAGLQAAHRGEPGAQGRGDGEERVGVFGHQRGEVDHPPPTRGLHRGGGQRRHAHDVEHRVLETGRPLLLAERAHRPGGRSARVRDEDQGLPQGGAGVGEPGRDVVFGGDVAAEGPVGGSEQVLGFFDAAGVEAADRDLRPFGGQRARGGEADAARGGGDHGDLAPEPEVHGGIIARFGGLT
jgi:hypothetical protein